MSGERSAMKAAHAESTRRILVRPAARAVAIAPISKGRSVSPAARVGDTANSGASPVVCAAATSLLPAGTPRNSAPKRWNASEPGTASTCSNVGSPTRIRRDVRLGRITGGTGASTGSNGNSDSRLSAGMQCSSSKAADAICAANRWPERFTSITIGHAVRETSPAASAYVVWQTRNAIRGSVSLGTIRTGFGELPMLWKKRRSECLLRVASLAAAINPRPRLNPRWH